MTSSLLALIAVLASSAAPPTRTDRPAVVIEPARAGFRWADAAIGAAAAVGVVLVAGGVVVLARSRQSEKESL